VAGKYKNTVVALGAKDLAVKDYFTPAGSASAAKKGSEVPGATPAVFTWDGRDVIVAGGTDGRIYLLDSASLGGADHHTPLAQSEVFAAADGVNGIRNAFATWEDPGSGNARWIYASISGASPLKFPTANGAAPTGSIVAFKVDDRGGSPVLIAQWSSRDMILPAAPAVTNGLVFALSTGQSARDPKNAVLYALDSSTGREIWSSGTTATSYATGGLAINASMVLFATHDSQLHAYGIPIVF
jgi:outer membrane protein assembly factor BamB